MKQVFLIAMALLLALSGCTQAQDGPDCAQVVTPAISPEGECTEYATPCDVPKGFTLAESCEAPAEEGPEEPEENEPEMCAQVITPAISPEGECTEYATPCDVPEGHEVIGSCPAEEPQENAKFDFTADMKFCEYNSLLKKYTMFFQIRNMTENSPTYQSKIWLKVPDFNNYAQAKTIQNYYTEAQILWEEQSYTHVSEGTMRGQYWEIRNTEGLVNADFMLIYCEPEFAKKKDDCTEETGIVVFKGNTEELCRVAGQID